MYKINLIDILGGGGVYEIKVSASVLGKTLGIKRRVSKWSKEQKRSLLTQWLRGERKHPLVPPKAGLPEVEHVYEDQTALMKSRIVWRRTGRIGVNGPHLKEASTRIVAPRHRDVVQVPVNITGPILATDPMSWERQDWKGGEVKRVREMRHPYKKKGKTVVVEDDDEKPSSSQPGMRGRRASKGGGDDEGRASSRGKGKRRKSKDEGKKKEGEDEGRDGADNDEKKPKKRGRSRGDKKDRPKSRGGSGSRPGSRSKSRDGRPNSRSKSREERRKKRESKNPDYFQNQYEEDADEAAEAKREAEIKAKADAAADAESKKER